MSTVCCHNEIDINEFEDTDILQAAVKIILSHRARAKPDNEISAKYWDLLQAEVDRVAAAVGVVIPDERQLPPASTAASVTSMTHLRAIMAKSTSH